MQNSSLARISRTIKSPCFFLIWSSLVLLSYFFLDIKIARFLHASVNLQINHIANLVSNFGVGGYYLLGFFILFLAGNFIFKNQRISRESLFLFLSVAIPGLICDLLKMLFGRGRPVMLFDHHLYGFYFLKFHSTLWSFPSGHATTIAGVMVALSLLYPRRWPVFFTVIILVSLSRLVVEAHFLSDVMMGGYLGALITLWIYEFLEKHSRLKLTTQGMNEV